MHSSLTDPGMQVCIKVECRFTKDTLKGDESSEIRVRLIEMLKDDFAPEEDDWEEPASWITVKQSST